MTDASPSAEQSPQKLVSDGAQSTRAPVHVSFFEEQARRRRSARLLSLACLVIAGGIGIVLSTVITPMLLLIAGFLLKLLAWSGAYSAEALGAAHWLGRWVGYHLHNFDLLISSLDKINRLRDISVTFPPLAALSTICLPGLAAAALVWLGVRRIFARVEGEDLVHRLQARPPKPDDREERQLANIVEEMAISAGLQPPRLLVIDSPLINAAAVGRSHDDATVLVTRGLLEHLDRQETSGVVAHLVAAIGEGDIGITASILAVFQTLGFFLTVLDLPFRWSAWRALGGLVLAGLAIRRSPEAIARTAEQLEEAFDAGATADVDKMAAWVPFPKLRKFVIAPVLPLLLLSVFMKLVLFLWTSLFLSAPLSLLWRNRRYSADAMAVQLTRDPDGLAHALGEIAGSGVPPGGEAREYFFVHATRGSAKGGIADRRAMTLTLHPTIARRVARLVALGATSEAGTRSSWLDYQEIARRPLAAAIVVGLLLLLVPLVIALVLAVGYITAIVMTMALAGGLTIAAAILG